MIVGQGLVDGARLDEVLVDHQVGQAEAPEALVSPAEEDVG